MIFYMMCLTPVAAIVFYLNHITVVTQKDPKQSSMNKFMATISLVYIVAVFGYVLLLATE
ncbi:hypothetical protein DQG13_21090 [Paenibacillus sp. YN15]|nr:hypothetical protein DQG13_21090 [Paenibacillus sp. YN15]